MDLVIAKNKLKEVQEWFCEHFVRSTREQYLERCPIVILQGPTGSGKTSTLRWISKELKIPIKEYSETMDHTFLNYEISDLDKDEPELENLTKTINRRKALQFENFIIHSLRYSTLYPQETTSENDLPEEESGFDSDDDEEVKRENNLPEEASEFDSDDDGDIRPPPPPPPPTNVIIHIDTPLVFARSQKTLVQTLHRLLRVIRNISTRITRRIAIVFETLEGEGDIISLSIKVKQSLRIQVLKFNKITRVNMKRLVETLSRDLYHFEIDKESLELLIDDSDGDMRACVNTLQLISEESTNHQNSNTNNVQQAIKKQKLMPDLRPKVILKQSLMRDNTRNFVFFNVLGKIFYQKRLYPVPTKKDEPPKQYRSIERPFETENSTEYLANLVDTPPQNLIVWLHHHFYKFCGNTNMAKAALFLENLSDCDTTSINSTQSSQFYESHNTLDQLQTHLAIESTVFSLYEDQSSLNKPRLKKIIKGSGQMIIKPSVENFSSEEEKKGELYGFTKPASMSLGKLVEDYESLLVHCRAELVEVSTKSIDPLKVLLDYVPYMNYMSTNWSKCPLKDKDQFPSVEICKSIYDNVRIMDLFKILENLEIQADQDFDTRHEKLLEMIDNIEVYKPNLR